jgi:putative transposase
MTYDPDKHHRHSIRLAGYDYSQHGAFYVTICSQGRRRLFGEIVDATMRLNDIDKIVAEQWYVIPERFPTIELDAFVVMPNHIHGIFANILETPPTETRSSNSTASKKSVPTAMGNVVGAYKSLCVYHVLDWIKHNQPNRILGKFWQRNFWEHIIRDEDELNHIREYIYLNPRRWHKDVFNADRKSPIIESTQIREAADDYEGEAWMQ